MLQKTLTLEMPQEKLKKFGDETLWTTRQAPVFWRDRQHLAAKRNDIQFVCYTQKKVREGHFVKC